MVKKPLKKKVIKKPIQKKTTKKISGKTKNVGVAKKKVTKKSYKKKINLVLKNLIIFALFSILSIFLNLVFSNELLSNFFNLLAWISGFVVVAFLIVLLAFLFLKTFRK